MTQQERYEYVAFNFNTLTTAEIAENLGETIGRIHTMVYLMRKRGVPIPRSTYRRHTESKRGRSIDYEAIKKLFPTGE